MGLAKKYTVEMPAFAHFGPEALIQGLGFRLGAVCG